MDNETLEDCRAVYLTAEDLRIAASILYNAYHDDPFLSIHFSPQIKLLTSKTARRDPRRTQYVMATKTSTHRFIRP
ncbi:hypothetical protein LFREDSHE_15630 [Shewanella baltica]